jgi:acetyltransferase-like isoleucine patch superfamily enzyme
MTSDASQPDSALPPGRWADGSAPANVSLGLNTLIAGADSFKRFYSKKAQGLSIGANCLMEGVKFAIGPDAQIIIGNGCYFSNVILLCDLEIRIGNHVMIGWNTCIADTDFHPLDPQLRIDDAIACSPLAQGVKRPPVQCRPVSIGSNVYIGPAVTLLKGVNIGDGAWIEPGSLVTRDVPAGARVIGNPAQIVAPNPVG